MIVYEEEDFFFVNVYNKNINKLEGFYFLELLINVRWSYVIIIYDRL